MPSPRSPLFRLILLLLLTASLTIQAQSGKAYPASSFTLRQDGDWYDNWGIDRNNYAGAHGFLPNLASETLNENKQLAFSIGENFKTLYPGDTERAVAILKYVQTWTEYGYDSDNVVREGIPQEEWAWNADEMANAFNENTGVKAVGDCEDLAFLCATIYAGAGFQAAILDAPGHVALLIWLPELPNANSYWDLPNDDKDAGWIWVEATGSSNPLGWTPPDFQDGRWNAYAIDNLENLGTPQPTWTNPLPIDIDSNLMLALLIFAFFIILALARSRR